MRKFLCLLLIALCLCAGLARAEEAVEDIYLELSFLNLRMDYASLGVPPDTRWPVYSAPFDSAWRPDQGEAALRADQPFTVLGFLQNGQWACVEYTKPDGARRVGWARLPVTTDDPNSFGPIDRKPAVLLADVVLTDDPGGRAPAMATLRRGGTVICMGTLPGKDGQRWRMVEATLEGRPAWGFIPESAPLRAIPLYRVEGDTMILSDSVTILGDGALEYVPIGDETADPDSWNFSMQYVDYRPGDISLSIELTAGFMEPDVPVAVRRVVLPATLRCLTADGLISGSLDELRLDGCPEAVSSDAFYAVDIKTVTLASTYTADLPLGMYCSVGAYAVEAGNPRYTAVDGVLFTADKKTLLRYPNRRTDEHYDVPKGTEHIAASAFSDDGSSLPLKTISLPIGLKTIGQRAFDGCGRLISLTVPLTVTELADDALDLCVSLERLSLPPGLRAQKNPEGVKYPDLTYYNGDNGETSGRQAGKPLSTWLWCDARVDPATGAEEASVYADFGADAPIIGTLPTGARVQAQECRNGRVRVQTEDKKTPIVALSDLTLFHRDPLFSVDRAVPLPGAVTLTDGVPADPAWLELYDLDALTGVCLLSPADTLTEAQEALLPLEEQGFGLTVTLPLRQVTLYTANAGDHACAYLCGPASAAPIPLYDAPGGAQTAHGWTGQQVYLGEACDGWREVVTPLGRWWAEEASIIQVLPLQGEPTPND